MRVGHLPDQHAQRLGQLDAGVKQRGQLARKAGNLLAGALFEQTAQRPLGRLHPYLIDGRRVQAAGAKLDAAAHRRLGDSFTAIGKTPEAIANYRQAMMLDPATAVPLERRIVEAQIETRDFAGAMVSLESHLRREELSESERAWAMTAAARILIDRNELSEARQLLAQAMAFVADDPAEQGQVNYWLGYCQYRLGAAEEAERYLRLSRDQLKIQHPLDGEAAYLLGRILQARGEHAEAIAFFETVLVSHPGTDSAWLARLGRGVSRIARGDDDAGLSDLQDLVAKILSGEVQKVGPLDEVVGQLLAAGHRLIERGNYKGALEVMAWEQQVRPEPSATFFERLATVYEQRAGQVEKGLRQLTGAERVRAEQQLRELRTRAGDAHVAHARAVAAVSDAKYGESLWRGIEWYQSAGDLGRVISALELFIAERPDDPLTSEALLRLGRAFQAAGYYDKAIEAFQRNQFRFPNSLAAQKSAVPLAQALIARGGPSVARAETVLLGVIEGNDVLTPESQEFRLALQELAQLYYREGRFEEAIYRLVEITERYPGEQQAPRMRFLMADSYRKSAGLLADRIQVAQAGKAVREAMDLAEAVEARKERLTRAREIFAQVIEGYQARPPADAPMPTIGSTCWLGWSADCSRFAAAAGAGERAFFLSAASAVDGAGEPPPACGPALPRRAALPFPAAVPARSACSASAREPATPRRVPCSSSSREPGGGESSCLPSPPCPVPGQSNPRLVMGETPDRGLRRAAREEWVANGNPHRQLVD